MDCSRQHPSEEVLEQYALERLLGEELERVEEHLLICEDCRSRLSALDEFVQAFRAVSEVSGPITFAHQTEDGPVFLQVFYAGGGFWVGKFWGAELEGRQVFSGPEDAWEYVRRSFQEMFPGHICTQACRQEKLGEGMTG